MKKQVGVELQAQAPKSSCAKLWFNPKLAWQLVMVICVALAFSAHEAVAQSAFGSIGGVVTDPKGGVIQGAQATATDEGSGITETTQTDNKGEFTFPSLLPATYTVSIEKPGFEKLEKTGLALVAAQRFSAGTFQLSVGSVTANISVSGAGTPVETTSSEISSTISTEEMAKLPSLGLDYMAFTQILPGSSYVGWGNSGLALNSTSVNFNGLSGQGTGAGTYVSTNGVYSSLWEQSYDADAANLDNIQDVHVLASNYEAQYGRVIGAVINVTTKSGSSHYNGGAFYYFRNEALNANDYFSKLDEVLAGEPNHRPRYRYNTFGGTFGGPALIPGWSQAKNKLFFFADFAYAPSTSPAGPRTYVMPTALERQGDFSQSYIPGTTTLYKVIDPTTGQQFPNNMISSGRLNPTMQALFNSKLFPMPNSQATLTTKGYNYLINDSDSNPTNKESLRFDYAATSRLRVFGRWQRAVSTSTGRNEAGLLCGWQTGTETYGNTDERFEGGGSYTITPHMVNEASGGWTRDHEYLHAPASEVSQFQTTSNGVTFANPYPEENTSDLLPGMNFTNGPSFTFEPRFPLDDKYTGWSISDSVTYVVGSHQVKFGAYIDSLTSYQPHHTGQWGNAGSGIFNFSSPNPNNPYNTGNSMAEGLLGYFDSYEYATNRVTLDMIERNFEWYGQDNWKVTPKLTVSYGLRFTADIPVKNGNSYGSQIDFSQYNPADTPPLFQPVEVNGTRMTQNPVNGTLEPAAYEGYFVPGVGNPASGSVSVGNKSLTNSKGVLVAPRLGFAYDPFGDGKTVVRGAFGQFFTPRTRWGTVYGNVTNAPTVFYPTQYYGNISTFAGLGGLLGPSNDQYMDPHGDLPTSLQWSLGVQRELGFKTVFGASYVANVTRHGQYQFNLDEVPYGSEFLPQNQDPTTGTPLPTNYYVPYPGYSSITYIKFGDSGNYNSLQATLERKFANSLTYGVAYTWSRALDDNLGTTYIPRNLTYGPVSGSNRPNRLTADWVWDTPKGSRYWNNPLGRTLLDNWSFSGIASFIDGPSSGVSCGTTNGLNITGGGDNYSCIVSGDPILSKGSRTFNRYIKTSAYSLPSVLGVGQQWTTANVGNQWHSTFYEPGENNWDLSFIKGIPLKEQLAAQLRVDMINAFNHASFYSINNNANFDPSTGQQVNNAFGQLNGDLGPRIVQISARIKF